MAVQGRDTRQEDVEGSPTQSRISPSIQRILKQKFRWTAVDINLSENANNSDPPCRQNYHVLGLAAPVVFRSVHQPNRKVDIRLDGKGNLKLPWRKAGQQSHLVDVVDSDQ